MLVNTLFRYFETADDPEFQKSITDAIDAANLSGDPEDWAKIGAPIGRMFAEFMNFEIPSYELKYGDYQKGAL